MLDALDSGCENVERGETYVEVGLGTCWQVSQGKIMYKRAGFEACKRSTRLELQHGKRVSQDWVKQKGFLGREVGGKTSI